MQRSTYKRKCATPLFAATNKGNAVSAEVTDVSLRVAIRNVKDHLQCPCSGLLVAGLLIRVRYIYLYAKRNWRKPRKGK